MDHPFVGLRVAMGYLNENFRFNLFQESHVPDKLFQYTDIYGLRGILEKKQWWATHYRYLNDGKEIIYAGEMIKNHLNNLLKFKPNELIANIYSKTVGEESPIIGIYDYDIYLTSFSENGDLLDQWRAYGSNGIGYSIGINASRLKYKISGPHIETQRGSDLAFVKVIYDQNQQGNLISQLVDEAERLIMSVYQQIKPKDVEGFCDEASQQLSRILRQLTLFFKHPAFINEQEWRVVKKHPKTNDAIDKSVRFRTSENRLIPYLELDFHARDNPAVMPICEIILGPKHRITNSEESLRMYLRSLGYSHSDFPIKISELPYQ